MKLLSLLSGALGLAFAFALLCHCTTALGAIWCFLGGLLFGVHTLAAFDLWFKEMVGLECKKVIDNTPGSHQFTD